MEKYRYYPPCVDDSMVASKVIHRRKKSLWNWAPMRAFAKIRQQQYHCVFSIFVQTIDGLPLYMDGLRLVVQLERKSKLWQTMPSAVFQHAVDFDETLHIETTIFGRETNMEGHNMKFMPKDYILSVVSLDAEEHFLFNRHRIDLSCLLPTSIEGFWEPNKPMSSTASFKLGGKAEGAVLVATFDFEVLNEELRRPCLFLDGNASARFGASSFPRLSRAVKSLSNSPTPSPFVRCVNHFTTPCSSDPESTDSTGIGIGKFDLDSSAKETEEWSVYDYSSSDEERFQALKNDPLSLDASTEADIVISSTTATTLKEELGSLDDFNTKLHLANVERAKKVKVSLVLNPQKDALCHQMDCCQMLVNSHPENGNRSPCGNNEMDKLEVLEGRHHVGDVAADKFCINVEIAKNLPTADIPMTGANDVTGSEVGIERQCITGDAMVLSNCANCKDVDDCGEALLAEEIELSSEINAKHWLVEGAQSFSDQEVRSTSASHQNENRLGMDTQAQSNSTVTLGQHSWENVAHENVLENLWNASVEGLDEDSTILQVSAEDEITREANEVFEDFLDLLEREEDCDLTGPCFPVMGALEMRDKEMVFPKECWPSPSFPSPSVQEGDGLLRTSHTLEKLLPISENSQERQPTCEKPGKSVPKYDSANTSCEDEPGLLSIIETAEVELKKAAQRLQSKERAKILEDAETKALMKEWGLSDKIFERPVQNLLPCSVSKTSCLSDSTSVISLKDGGCLKAMSGHSYSNLMLQASKAVVIPVQSSLCAIDILSSMASQGLEDMTAKAFMKMPLEDLAASSMDHLMRTSGSNSCCPCSWQGPVGGLIGPTNCSQRKPFKAENLVEKVFSFEDFIPVALNTIEPLAIEGLKLQCNFSKKAPCTVPLKSFALQSGMNDQVLQEKLLVNDGRQVERPDTSLLDMAISLDEWLQLSGQVSVPENEVPVSLEPLFKEENKNAEQIPRWPTWAHQSHGFTVAMRLQLHDPQRYYEPVGASMMALVQLERLKQAFLWSDHLEEGSEPSVSAGGMDQFCKKSVSGVQLRLTGVHLSGAQQSEDCGCKCWGTKQQLKSGYRWFMANRKSSSSRHAVMSQALVPFEVESKLESLWSISACVNAEGGKWRELEGFCPCIRNPDLVFGNR